MIEVNSLWIGNRLSTLEVLAITSHLRQGHVFRLWTYDPVANVPDGVHVHDGNEILPTTDFFTYRVGEGAGSVSAFSNVFRYKLLAERGGWWVDSDVVALKPFAFDEPYVFASERHRNGSSSPTTCVIYSKEPSRIMLHCQVIAQTLIGLNGDELQWGSLGPRLLQEVLFKADLTEYAVSPDTFCPVNWFDAESDPPVHSPPDLSGSHAVHLWHEMWRRKGIDKDGSYGDCLFERLKSDVLQVAEGDRH
jgi:hypothetical protein